MVCSGCGQPSRLYMYNLMMLNCHGSGLTYFVYAPAAAALWTIALVIIIIIFISFTIR